MAGSAGDRKISTLQISTLFAGWAARWVSDSDERLASLLAWLDQNPELSSGMPHLTTDVVGGGLLVFIHELDEIMEQLTEEENGDGD